MGQQALQTSQEDAETLFSSSAPSQSTEIEQAPFSAPPSCAWSSDRPQPAQSLTRSDTTHSDAVTQAQARLMSHWADDVGAASLSVPRQAVQRLPSTEPPMRSAGAQAATEPTSWLGETAANVTQRVLALTHAGSRMLLAAEQHIDQGVDWAEAGLQHGATSIAAWGHGVPVVGAVADATAGLFGESVQLAGGAVKGATSLATGIGNMALHPFDTAQGLATLAEHLPGPLSMAPRLIHGLYDAANGTRSVTDALAYGLDPCHFSTEDAQYFRQLGRALAAPYAKSIAEGKPAEALGRGLFDVGSLFIGGAEAKVARDAGRAAGRLGLLERSTVAPGEVLSHGTDAAARAALPAALAALPIEQRMYQAIQRLWNRPLTPEVRAELQARWQRIEESAEALRLEPMNPADPAVAAAQERIQALRLHASGTAQGKHGGIVGGTADQSVKLVHENWLRADGYVRSMVEAKQPLSVQSIQDLNRLLGTGLEHNNGVPGRLRADAEHAYAAKELQRAYLPPSEIPTAMDDFLRWHENAQGHLPPIEHAAQAYQRLVSIHPFADANGRTCRLVMDYVLQSHGLPPATLVGSEVNTAVFGIRELFGTGNVPADHAVRSVTQGVERTLAITQDARNAVLPAQTHQVASPLLPALRLHESIRRQRNEPEQHPAH